MNTKDYFDKMENNKRGYDIPRRNENREDYSELQIIISRQFSKKEFDNIEEP